MIRHYIYILLLLFSSITFSQSIDKNENSKELKLIISISSFHNAKTEDAQALAEILSNHIKKSKKLNYTFLVETPSTLDEISRSLSTDFDCVILTTDEYISLSNKFPLDPFATNLTSKNVGYNYHLIVNKDDNISEITQLKNETIYVLARDNQKAPYLWLDKILAEKKLSNNKKFFKNIVTDYKATNVLLPVFFRKAKACVVTDASLNLMVELNPAIKNNIKILQTSDRFLLGLVALNKKKRNTELYNLLSEIILTLHENEYGKQLLSLFNADGLTRYKEEYLQNYIKLNK